MPMARDRLAASNAKEMIALQGFSVKKRKEYMLLPSWSDVDWIMFIIILEGMIQYEGYSA